MITLIVGVLLAGVVHQGFGPLRVGQDARTLHGAKWLTGVVEYQPGLRAASNPAGRDSCLGLNLDSSGLPYSITLHASDSLEVWVTDAPASSSAPKARKTGHWVGVPLTVRRSELCP